MAVQAFYTMGFMSCFGTQLVLALLVTRLPLNFVLRNEPFLTLVSCIGNAATGKRDGLKCRRGRLLCVSIVLTLFVFAAFLLFLSVSIFGGQCYRRDWLPYPNFNYLSWGFAFAIVAMFIHAFAALILLGEYKIAKERKAEGEGHLVMPMQTRGPSGMSNMGSESHQFV